MGGKKLPKSRKKRDKKKEQVFKTNLYDFLKDYGEPPEVQSASEADTDNQLKSITLHIADIISKSQNGTVIDIGCGNGVVLSRLAGIDYFLRSAGWSYVGCDFPELLRGIINLGIDLHVQKKVDAIPISELYGRVTQSLDYIQPHIVIVRNVFHELKIAATAELMNYLLLTCGPRDSIVIQDLAVFPKAEKGNVCWIPQHIEELLKQCGFRTLRVDESSKSGNRWFTILASLDVAASMSPDEIKKKVIHFRGKQFRQWKDLGALHPDDAVFRDVRFAKIDFDLQFAALALDLQEAGAATDPLTRSQEGLVHRETFEKCLHEFVKEPQRQPRVDFPDALKHFRDRARSIDPLIAFMTKDSRLLKVNGPPLMGKTELLRHFLHGQGFKHNRTPVFVEVQPTSSVYNLLDSILSQIGCRIPTEVLRKFRMITFSDVQDAVKNFFGAIGGEIVVVFDHFENVLEASGKVSDPEIEKLLNILTEAEDAKVVLTSRKSEIDLSFLPKLRVYPEPVYVGRFPKGEHVSNVLQSFYLSSSYPTELIDAIDQHPFLAFLAGMYIEKVGEPALEEKEFLADLKLSMRTAIMSKIVDKESLPAIEAASRLRIPVPRKMIVSLSSEESASSAEALGVLSPFLGGVRDDLTSCIGALRLDPPPLAYDPEYGDVQAGTLLLQKDRERKLHEKIAKNYEAVYRNDSDPAWLREIHYHRMISGNQVDAKGFGAIYRSELFAASEYWYDKEKDFEKALWAYNLVHDLNQPGYYIRMRIASCKVRLGAEKSALRDEGEQEFAEVIRDYPQEYGVKSAYVDAELYVKDFSKALRILKDLGFKYTDTPWTAGQFGRSYAGIHDHKRAIQAFTRQLAFTPDPYVYEQLARCYHRLGDTTLEMETIQAGRKRHSNNRGLELYYGALLERIGPLSEALEVLDSVYRDDPSSAWAFFPLLRALARLLVNWMSQLRSGTVPDIS